MEKGGPDDHKIHQFEEINQFEEIHQTEEIHQLETSNIPVECLLNAC